MNEPQRQHTETIARAIVLDALAQALSDPAILAGAPASSPLADILSSAVSELGSAACRRALFALAELPPADADDLQRRFQAIVQAPDRRPVPLYESMALHGRLMSPAAYELVQLYRQYGLEPNGELPDSASVELAFLAMLVEAEADALLAEEKNEAQRWRKIQRQFLNEHIMTWLPLVGRALARSGDPHITVLGHLLTDFLQEEQLRVLMNQRRKSKGNIPFVDGEACGLCGFCVQTCPTGALWVSENDTATYLVLKPESCIGCAKCLPVCPDDALRMVGRPQQLSPTIILHQSPRVHCPRCGAATVSRAELDAVFSRLEADAQLRYRLSLCESCKGRV